MGTSKQLLKWGDSTIIGHVIKVAQELNQENIYVVLGANSKGIKPEIEHHSIQILINEAWKLGLGKSIAFGVQQIKESDSNIDGVLILLTDQPLIHSNYLNELIVKFKTGTRQIIASSYNNGKQGVPVLFDKIYFKELSKLKDDKGANSILKKYSNKVTAINGIAIVSDIDTLEDYQRLYKSYH